MIRIWITHHSLISPLIQRFLGLYSTQISIGAHF